jgi:hypothetical protein
MKMFWQNQQQPQPVIPPELQPYYGDHSRLQGWKRWALPLAIVLALIIIAVVIWVIIGPTNSDKSPSKPNSQQTSQPETTSPEKTTAPTKTPASDKLNTKPIEL